MYATARARRLVRRYAAAFYWAVYTLTSVGYGDITAQNTTEYFVASICMLFGAIIWAFIVGNACSIVRIHTMMWNARAAASDGYVLPSVG